MGATETMPDAVAVIVILAGGVWVVYAYAEICRLLAADFRRWRERQPWWHARERRRQERIAWAERAERARDVQAIWRANPWLSKLANGVPDDPAERAEWNTAAAALERMTGARIGRPPTGG